MTYEVKISGTASVCQIVELTRGFILVETFDAGSFFLVLFDRAVACIETDDEPVAKGVDEAIFV